jgi:hypothetical protein
VHKALAFFMGNIYKKIWNLVMPIQRGNETKKTVVETPELDRDEIIWLMNLIKDGTFKGSDVQTVYETVVKLQLMLNKKG